MKTEFKAGEIYDAIVEQNPAGIPDKLKDFADRLESDRDSTVTVVLYDEDESA